MMNYVGNIYSCDIYFWILISRMATISAARNNTVAAIIPIGSPLYIAYISIIVVKEVEKSVRIIGKYFISIALIIFPVE